MLGQKSVSDLFGLVGGVGEGAGVGDIKGLDGDRLVHLRRHLQGRLAYCLIDIYSYIPTYTDVHKSESVPSGGDGGGGGGGGCA